MSVDSTVAQKLRYYDKKIAVKKDSKQPKITNHIIN
jgi:hypothetical protein